MKYVYFVNVLEMSPTYWEHSSQILIKNSNKKHSQSAKYKITVHSCHYSLNAGDRKRVWNSFGTKQIYQNLYHSEIL